MRIRFGEVFYLLQIFSPSKCVKRSSLPLEKAYRWMIYFNLSFFFINEAYNKNGNPNEALNGMSLLYKQVITQ